MHPKIKICGLTRPEDIEAANTAKTDYIGFVFAESRRQVTPAQARELRGLLAPGIVPVGVFVNAPLGEIEEILAPVRGGIIDAVQLHGTEDEAYILALKALLDAKLPPDRFIPIIKAVAVQKPGDAQAWENSAADYLLLDHKGGGTGEAFDWDLIGEMRKPFFLAGGLNTENITAAIKKTAPYAVDVSSGVETSPGVKCPEKIAHFINKVRLQP